MFQHCSLQRLTPVLVILQFPLTRYEHLSYELSQTHLFLRNNVIIGCKGSVIRAKYQNFKIFSQFTTIFLATDTASTD